VKRYIYDLNKGELEKYILELGEARFRASQIYTALHKGTEFSKINISKELKEKIVTDFDVELPKIVSQIESTDGTKKFLLELSDGNLIETVLLIQEYGTTVCVSSQVGCKMGCAFCASGKDGFVRNLTVGEILSQVLICNNVLGAKVSHIVLMGSGEPFDNFDNVIKFLRVITNVDGLNIGARNISVSTAGLVPKIKEFADLKLQVNLCVSLHAPNDDIRKKIMNIAKVYSIDELLKSAKYFFDKTKRRVIFEYALIDGVNSSQEHAMELVKRLKSGGFSYHINLINLNKTADNPLQPPSREVALKFLDTLIKNGASATMRKSRGSDIAAACGQLKRQVTNNGK